MADNLTAEIYTEPLKSVSQRVRIAKWDNAKFLLIMIVVIGHFLDTYGRGADFCDWLRFSRLFLDMPAFIFISGLFSKKTIDSTPMPFYKILPYFNLFLVIRILMFINIRLLRDPNYQLSFFDFQTLAWFCFAIFIFHIVTRLIRDIDVRYTMFFALLVACFAGYDKSIGNFLCLSRMILFFPFFLAGYATSREKSCCYSLREKRLNSLLCFF